MRISLLKICVGLLLLAACAPAPTTPSIAVLPTAVRAEGASDLPTPTPTTAAPLTLTPTPTPVPQGETVVVTSTSDSGPGTLRQALLEAQAGVTIIFDSAVFPPDDPSTIFLTGELPAISQGHVTIDGSNAGVVLDGSNISSGMAFGLQLYSDGNTIRGLQIVSFAECGVVVSGQAQHNVIGGDRNIGTGPIGQANLISGNNNGIGIWDEGASLNTVTGNFIGTDSGGEAAWGNGIGVVVSSGANHNTIGPGNLIANNYGYGVSIVHPTSLHNAITQNSIHSNGEADIRLEYGGNSELLAPIIIDYDVAAGTIAGSACPTCTIEVYSRDADGGIAYEGQTTADSSGVFLFDRVSRFTYPIIMASATDPDGDTSTFSAPTSGTSGAIAMQSGNCLPMTQIQHLKSQELEDNRIGNGAQMFHLAQPEHVWFQDPEDYVDLVGSLGFKWHRTGIDLDWCDRGDPLHPQWDYSRHRVDPRQDRAIDGLNTRGIKVMFMLFYWDETIQTREDYSRFRTEDEITRYLEYIRFIVSHFEGRIEYYILGNEPDIRHGTQQYVAVADYVNLAGRVVPVIRQEDPKAKIVIGGVSPLVYPESREYFFEILRSDVISSVDAISWHTNSPASPEYMAEEYYEYLALLQEIRNVASGNGFTGEYFAEELHWRTAENPYSSEHNESRYSGFAASKYLARGIIRHLGMDFATGIANEGHSQDLVIQNLTTSLAGAAPVELSLEIESEEPLLTNFDFALSNGDLLVAIWSDGIAVEDDPGVPATLTLPGLAAQEVVGIDVLHGFEQRMIANVEDGNLVIPNLLVKDYPIILRITPASSP